MSARIGNENSRAIRLFSDTSSDLRLKDTAFTTASVYANGNFLKAMFVCVCVPMYIQFLTLAPLF